MPDRPMVTQMRDYLGMMGRLGETLRPYSGDRAQTWSNGKRNVPRSPSRRTEELVGKGRLIELRVPLPDPWWSFFPTSSSNRRGNSAFSFERAKNKASDFKDQIKSVKSVKVIDDYTVDIITDGPNPILPNQLTNIYIMDKGWAEKNNVVKPQDFSAKEENYAVRNANGTGRKDRVAPKQELVGRQVVSR